MQSLTAGQTKITAARVAALFSLPDLRLAGVVDAGEGFFLLARFWSFSERQWWALPAMAVLGATTKESFIPFSIVFTTAWWLSVRKDSSMPPRNAVWILSSWAASVATMISRPMWVGGTFVSPIHFAATLHGKSRVPAPLCLVGNAVTRKFRSRPR